jgi:hypothetical protein
MLVVTILALAVIVFAIGWLCWINRMPRLTPVSEEWLKQINYNRRQERLD